MTSSISNISSFRNLTQVNVPWPVYIHDGHNSQEMNKLDSETICIHVNEGQIFTFISHPNSVGNLK